MEQNESGKIFAETVSEHVNSTRSQMEELKSKYNELMRILKDSLSKLENIEIATSDDMDMPESKSEADSERQEIQAVLSEQQKAISLAETIAVQIKELETRMLSLEALTSGNVENN